VLNIPIQFLIRFYIFLDQKGNAMSNTHYSAHFTQLVGFIFLLGCLPLAQAETDCATVTQIPQAECEALVDLYTSTDGAKWRNKTGWNVTNTPCNWYGVSCDGEHVIRLYQYGDADQYLRGGLRGAIPESLGNLKHLERLDLSFKKLNGSIPESLGHLKNLEFINLWFNELSGSIPESLLNLKKLAELDLSRNQLSGSMPESLGNVKSLQYLALYRNKFSGSIPESLGNLKKLVELDLGYNQLNGSIPESLGNLKNLETLSLDGNQLSGSIPESLGNLRGLKFFYLENNQLSGSIPESLGNLSNLKTLFLYYNQLSGSIPESLGNLQSLEVLFLFDNQLSGSISESLGNLQSLIFLYLDGNKLSGYIPESLGNLQSLAILYLSDNKLSGSLPESLGNLSSLEELDLYNNELCGDIPLSLMNLSQLSWLSLDNNHLTASDPALIQWLNSKNPSWETQTPCPKPQTCLVYGVHDGGLNNSQFFTISPIPENVFEIKALGAVHSGYDLEGLDIHPQTGILYASSGDDPATGLNNGYLYQVNKNNGTLTPVCSLGLGEVSAISFHPKNYTLWVWADGEGLYTIDIDDINNNVCAKTERLVSDAKVESMAWDNEGKILYGAEETTLFRYFYETGETDQACDHFPSQVEALSMLADDTLLFALDEASDTSIHLFDIDNCSVKNSVLLPVDTPYTDIEGMTWICL
jgi:Leucine-rich repeat (LRR) protein